MEMTQAALAHRMGRPVQVISEIFSGKKAITAQTALELERVLETPGHTWMKLQAQYELVYARSVLNHVPAPPRLSRDLGGRSRREGIPRIAIFARRSRTVRRAAERRGPGRLA